MIKNSIILKLSIAKIFHSFFANFVHVIVRDLFLNYSSNLLEMICREIPQNDLQLDNESVFAILNTQKKRDNDIPVEKALHNLKLDTNTPAFEKIRKMLVGLTASLPLHEEGIG